MTYRVEINRGESIKPLVYKKSTLPEARRRLESSLEDLGMRSTAYSFDEATKTFHVDASKRYAA